MRIDMEEKYPDKQDWSGTVLKEAKEKVTV